MARHGHAKVRPDGKVSVGLALNQSTYERLFTWSREWGMTMGEAVEHLIAHQAKA